MIDDVKAEGDAFKYSKKNLLDDILYYRYENEARTIITCNYDKNHPNDLEKAIDEFGTKYDGRIYDRLFEMFNIIEVKDLKSFSQQSQILKDLLCAEPVVHHRCVVRHESLIRFQNGFEYLVHLACSSLLQGQQAFLPSCHHFYRP